MKLGRLGVWYAIDKLDAGGLRQLLATVEGLGYDALWYPESRGYESMSIASFMLANTKTLKIGSSIANIYARDAVTARRGFITLRDLYGDRFIFGLGVSHVPNVEGVRGHVYDKPVPTMRRYLDAMTRGEAGAEAWPVALAALGPLMLKLSFEKTMGALPYNVTPAHTRKARKAMDQVAGSGGKWLAVEQKVAIETDAAKARALGRKELARYMVLDNYRNNWLRLGFSEQDLADGGSDRFIDAMVNWGDTDAVKRQLRAHVDAGATHVCLKPVHADGDFAARDRTLKALVDT